LLISSATLFCISFWTVLVLIPLYAVHLHYSLSGIGFLAAVPGLMQVVSRLLSGLLGDLWGEVFVIRLCYAVATASAWVLVTRDPGLGTLVLAQFLSGLGRGLFWASAQSYASRLPGDSARHLGGVSSTTFVGSTIALLVGGAASQLWGFTPVFAAAGVLSAVALLLSIVLPPNRAGVTRRNATQVLGGFRELAGQRTLWVAGALAFLAGIPNALTMSFFLVYGLSIGLGGALATAATAARNVGGFGGSNGCSHLLRRFGEWPVRIGSLVLLAVGLFWTGSSNRLTGFAIAVALSGLAGSVLNVYYLWIASRVSDARQRTTAMGLTGSMWALSMLVTPAIFGLAGSRFGLEATFRGAGLLVMAIAFVAAWGARSVRNLG
jgi:DHA1 family multidrug resistance protein-like MFS transporter